MTEPFQVFHQREDLTTRIRNILRDYPRGTLPLREFVQNADDAGAKRFAVLLDIRDTSAPAPSAPSDAANGNLHTGYLSPLMKEFDRSRDSLFIFNDSTFSERDFESITSLGNSIKQTDQTAVGKYGLGFNVAYHYSDVVSFVSRDQLVVFDPHQRHLPDQLPGLRANYTSPSFRVQFPQQMDGFSRAAAVLDCPHCGEEAFNGTLFRLPLRNESEAESSKISTACIDSTELSEVLREFANSAAELIVFLKHVEQIDVLVRRETSAGVSIERVGQTRILNIDAELQRQRCLLEHLTVSETTYGLDIEQTVQGEASIRQKWLVHSRLHESSTAETLSAALRERPFLGAALHLDSTATHEQLCANGRPYCFLPLPLKTGLPVHLNAFFALSSNRRGLWTGDNEAGGGDGVLRERWNAMLLEEALPLAYGGLLTALSARPDTTPSLLYKFWPSVSATSSSFRSVAEGLVDRVTHALPPTHRAFPLLFDRVARSWCPMAGRDIVFETAHSRAQCGLLVRHELQQAGVAAVDPPPHVRECIASRLAHRAPAAPGADGGSVASSVVLLTPAVAVMRLAGRTMQTMSSAQLLSFCWEVSVPSTELLPCSSTKLSYRSPEGNLSSTAAESSALCTPDGTTAPSVADGITLATFDALLRSKCACVPVIGGNMRCIGRPCSERPSKRAAATSDADSEQEPALIFCSDEWQPLLGSLQDGVVDLHLGTESEQCSSLAVAVLWSLCESGQTNLRQLVASDVSKQMPYLLPSQWRDHDIVILQSGESASNNTASTNTLVPSHLKSKAHATLRKQATAEVSHSRGMHPWADKLALLWRFLERMCFDLSDNSPELSIMKCREIVSADAVQEVLQLFDAWPIVPLECGAVVSCKEARSMGVLSCAELREQERELVLQCHVHLTPLNNVLVKALLFASREDVCRALAIAFESSTTLNAVSRSTRLQLRQQILRWKAERSPRDETAVAADSSALAAPTACSMTFQVSRVQRLPIFSTYDGDLKPITKDLFATPPPPTSRDKFDAASTWDKLLVRCVDKFGAKLLSYSDEDARAVLSMADMPRPLDEFDLLARLCDGDVLPLLSHDVWVEVLRASARVKPWKKARTPKLMQVFQTQRVIKTGDSSSRLASEVIDTSDSLLMACIRGTSVCTSASEKPSASCAMLPQEYTEPGVLTVLRLLGLITIESAKGFLLAARAVAEKGDVDLAFQLIGVLLKLHKDGEALPWPSSTYDQLASIPFVPSIVQNACDEWPAHGGVPDFISPAAVQSSQHKGKRGASQRTGKASKHAAAEESAIMDEERMFEFAQEQVEEAVSYLADATFSPPAAVAWELRKFSECVLFAGAWSAFTVCPILPAEIDRLPVAVLRRFHVAHPPAPKKVTRHLLNLARSWQQTAVPREQLLQVTTWRQALVQLCMVDLNLCRKELSPVSAASLISCRFVVLDDGEIVRPVDILFELSAGDRDLADDVRAPPAYLEAYDELFQIISEQSPKALAALPPPPVVVEAAPPTPTLERMQAEFDKAGLADVCMRLGPGQHLYLHRLFIGMASPVFQALFQSPMTGEKSCRDPEFRAAAGGRWRLEAPEWASAEGVRAFMLYLYTGTLPECLDDTMVPTQARVTGVIEQLRLASYYDCPHLLQSCEAFLASTEGVAQLTNLLDLLQLADDSDAQKLRAHVVHRAREALHIMTALPEWEALPEAMKHELQRGTRRGEERRGEEREGERKEKEPGG
eukprot:CAMPEP_0181299902 /NCGR_PEP_ID=MMETSP1101-20121128/6598_1 /TAXON_ID=46948 /ORGANISM="Rhodomonas abbreviata, Strain Caron Lab Isolate" /LENGTH=1728 /DNA_ID=CAMNT_0023405091 /DNA_START=13 /DNA_END=5195 /DNA_ORIENTATION=-